jgi:hypothetical protein
MAPAPCTEAAEEAVPDSCSNAGTPLKERVRCSTPPGRGCTERTDAGALSVAVDTSRDTDVSNLESARRTLDGSADAAESRPPTSTSVRAASIRGRRPMLKL